MTPELIDVMATEELWTSPGVHEQLYESGGASAITAPLPHSVCGSPCLVSFTVWKEIEAKMPVKVVLATFMKQ